MSERQEPLQSGSAPQGPIGIAKSIGRIGKIRLRLDPRWGRLITALEQFEIELSHLRESESRGSERPTGWHAAANELLDLAVDAAMRRRLDDSWSFLQKARRLSLNANTLDQLQMYSLALVQECDSKLTGWRRKAANGALSRAGLLAVNNNNDEQLARPRPEDVADVAGDRLRAQVLLGMLAAQELLDESSQNTYLRMRLLARRLVLTTAALVIVIAGLFLACPGTTIDNLPPTLTDRTQFIQAILLGGLGALLSFAIGSIRRGVDYRIYELASGNIATTLARILVGSGSALVTIAATQLDLLPIRPEWAILAGVAAGFSERFVRRVVESLSESAEEAPKKSSESPRAPSKRIDNDQAGSQPRSS